MAYPSAFNFTALVLQLCYIILPAVLGAIHVSVKKREASAAQKSRVFLIYYLFISVGLAGIISGILQLAFPEKVAAYVGWPYSPFLLEVGMANIAFGILGILSPWIKGTWKPATAIGYGLFLLMAGIGHIVDALVHRNWSFGNVGPPLWSDFLVPAALVILLYFCYRPEAEKPLE